MELCVQPVASVKNTPKDLELSVYLNALTAESCPSTEPNTFEQPAKVLVYHQLHKSSECLPDFKIMGGGNAWQEKLSYTWIFLRNEYINKPHVHMNNKLICKETTTQRNTGQSQTRVTMTRHKNVPYKSEATVLPHHRDLENEEEKYGFRCTFPSRPDWKGLMFSVESIKMYDRFNGSKETFLVLKSVNDRIHTKGPRSGLNHIPSQCDTLRLKNTLAEAQVFVGHLLP